MAVTNYYTMDDGMMIGESTNGVMRNYITDALGSVVGTVLNGVAENTYQYKPYGAVLAKTGTAPDPSFLWNGKSGYRATGLPNAEYYVLSRIVSSTTAQWTTVDLAWPAQAPYVYAYACPTLYVDPSGLWGGLEVQVTIPGHFLSNCGRALYGVKWSVFGTEPNGWVIQHIQLAAHKWDCKTGMPLRTNNFNVEYWEAWQVQGFNVYEGYVQNGVWPTSDKYLSKDEGDCTFGLITFTGHVKYIPNFDLTVPPWGDAYSMYSGILPDIGPPGPNGWSDASALLHQMKINYVCCDCCPYESQDEFLYTYP